jgi:hypothetical protein
MAEHPEEMLPKERIAARRDLVEAGSGSGSAAGSNAQP